MEAANRISQRLSYSSTPRNAGGLNFRVRDGYGCERTFLLQVLARYSRFASLTVRLSRLHSVQPRSHDFAVRAHGDLALLGLPLTQTLAKICTKNADGSSLSSSPSVNRSLRSRMLKRGVTASLAESMGETAQGAKRRHSSRRNESMNGGGEPNFPETLVLQYSPERWRA